MRFLPQDRHFLAHALNLAQTAAAFASPNPTVGCVLTQGDAVIGEGAHHFEARDHAEIVALKQAVAAGHSLRAATAYVTLEPCSFTGRTGPCCDALTAAGIARCVVATADPNPRVSGAGIARMLAAGVQVQVLAADDPLSQSARRLNDAFAFSIRHGRPFVTLKSAISADGKLAPAPALRSAVAPHWISGDAARADVQALRHASDAILTGIGTVLADDPSLTDRTGLPRRRPLLRVVLDSRLRLPGSSRLVGSALHDVLVVCAAGAPQSAEKSLRAAGVEVLRQSCASIDLHEVLRHLAAREIRSVLLEAGSALNESFLRADLVDRVALYRTAAELGEDAIPFAGPNLSPDSVTQRLTLPERKAFAHGKVQDTLVRGYLHDPWTGLA